MFQQGSSKCFQDGFKIYKYKSFGPSIIEFQLVSYQVWSNQAKLNEVQDHLVGWDHKKKRDHIESRRELNYPGNQKMMI